MSKLMRINDTTVSQLESLSKLTGQSKQIIMERAITLYAYEQIIKKANEQYAALKNDVKTHRQMQEEQADWDATLSDGLNDD